MEVKGPIDEKTLVERFANKKNDSRRISSQKHG